MPICGQKSKARFSMRIVDLDTTTEEGWVTGSATVIWERRRLAPQKLAFSTDEAHGAMLWASPDAFLTACLAPAAFHFEKRLMVEGVVCPTLVDGLQSAMETLYGWYRAAPPISLEVETLTSPRQPFPNSAAAVGFSGGVDSLASVRHNRLTQEPASASFFRYGVVLAQGFDAFEIPPDGWYWKELNSIAEDAQLELVPIKTNVRHLEPANHFFGSHLFGAMLASLGHILSRSINVFAIASGHEPGTESIPEGSHPDLDHLYSSGAVQVVHDDAVGTRFAKTALLAEWPVIHDKLKVCFFANRLESGSKNCGVCEKCLRTKLTLLSLGRLEDFDVFVDQRITPELLDEALSKKGLPMFYDDIYRGLLDIGEPDLADVVYNRMIGPKSTPLSLRSRLVRFETRRLKGVAKRSMRRLRR